LKKILGISSLLFILCHPLSAGKKPKPRNIDEAILYFETKWNDKQKEECKNSDEKTWVNDMHASLGVWIRNEWIYKDKDTALVNQFNRLGIDHPNDMSAIILTSLHRKLNNIPIDLDGQVKYYIDYWKPYKICDEKASRLAQETYNKFNVGDSIFIYMDVDAKFGTRNAVLHECPDTEWSFDYKNDLMIRGIVSEKYEYNDKGNMFFKVKIGFISSPNTTVLFKTPKVNDLMEFGLKYLLVKGVRS